MRSPVQVGQPPPKPLLVFDGDCNFCRFWIERWRQITGPRVDFIPFQDPAVSARFPELAREQCELAVQLIEPDGKVYSGAEAAFRALGSQRSWRWPLAAYRSLPGAAGLSERLYRVVARHRTVFSWLTRALWGSQPELPRYQLVRWIFLRGLGLVYLGAFLSLWVQMDGLLGSKGILPAAEYMKGAREFFDGQNLGGTRYYLMPTWCWISASDLFLHALCGAGLAGSLLLLVGIAPALVTALLWSCYLSLSVVGRDFLSFQWDALLLEVGLLAIFFAPLRWVAARLEAGPVPRVSLGLLRWLLFRLVFESGCVKLLSGDPTWSSLSALRYHYETQPLPPWTAYYVHQAPAAFHQVCVGVLFGIELVLPFLILGPRRLRLIAFSGLVLLQGCILLTGNYGFFNYLTLLLCLSLLDDRALSAMYSATGRWQWWKRFGRVPPVGHSAPLSQGMAASTARQWPRWMLGMLAAVIVVISVEQLAFMFRWNLPWLGPARVLADWAAPFRSINRYGLFAVMTTTRPELIVEGSLDRENWLAYEFKYKPGSPGERPRFVAPHQPRLDWQMWFAALGTPQQNPWLINFCVRLMQGSEGVLRLLETNPFPDRPPAHIRVQVYQYRFASRSARSRGLWWEREFTGRYLPSISLRNEPLALGRESTEVGRIRAGE